MTYEQSLKNIEILKNIVWPIDTGYYIFFDFYSESEFKTVLLNCPLLLNEKMCANNNAKLPVANIHCNKLGQEILFYDDQNLNIDFNLTTNKLIYDALNYKVTWKQLKIDLLKLKIRFK